MTHYTINIGISGGNNCNIYKKSTCRAPSKYASLIIAATLSKLMLSVAGDI